MFGSALPSAHVAYTRRGGYLCIWMGWVFALPLYIGVILLAYGWDWFSLPSQPDGFSQYQRKMRVKAENLPRKRKQKPPGGNSDR